MRTEPPFRADHVGSLLRPDPLRAARAKAAAGMISAEALREEEDRCIRDVVALQEEVGQSVDVGIDTCRHKLQHGNFQYVHFECGACESQLCRTAFRKSALTVEVA